MSDVWLEESQRQLMADMEQSFRDSLYTYTQPLTATLIAVYVVVFLLSVVGNTLVIIIIVLDRSNRGIDAYLMLNLAVADLLGTYRYVARDLSVCAVTKCAAQFRNRIIISNLEISDLSLTLAQTLIRTLTRPSS